VQSPPLFCKAATSGRAERVALRIERFATARPLVAALQGLEQVAAGDAQHIRDFK
jgi:hypothetical protein